MPNPMFDKEWYEKQVKLQLELKKNSKGREEGTGALLYSAKIKVLDGKSIDVESYGIGPIQLMGVRKF